ncbi:MAG: hypothetical protein K0R71_2277 [Bacillales bacterium]|jgi:hypothetical protein|nr:hypothetical protein [Bacillales bacterium]
MIKFYSFRGTVTKISDYMIGATDKSGGCFKLMSVEDGQGNLVNFVISPTTYFVDQAIVAVGDQVTGYYDGNTPVILIYPPQYQALIIVKENPYQNVKVDFFSSSLISSDGQLKINLSPYTPILLTNGQPFSGIPINRNLIVQYGPSTKSIPALTTPFKIIIWC